MRILYIAQSCDPYNGSEDAIGWNIPMQASIDENDVYVITRSDKKPVIDKWIKDNKDNDVKIPTFYYVDIPNMYKKVCKGFLYSGRLNVWHRKAIPIAKEICKNEKIEIIHQITPIEFRAIGKYYNIPNIKFVVGPLGGASFVQNGLKKYVPCKYKLVECFRKLINSFAKISIKATKLTDKVDKIIFSNPETKAVFINDLTDKNVFIELGIDKRDIKDINEIQRRTDDLRVKFLIPGRLIYIKGHRFLLDSLKKMPPELNYEINIVGDGIDYNYLQKKIHNDLYLKKHLNLLGKLPFAEMQKVYSENNVVLVPSIRENCATVMLEGYAYGLPVIALKKFGASEFVKENCGRFIYGKSNDELKKSLVDAMLFFIQNSNSIEKMGIKCLQEAQKYTWENKNKFYYRIYKETL